MDTYVSRFVARRAGRRRECFSRLEVAGVLKRVDALRC